MSITNYFKPCEITVPGNDNRLFIASYEDIDSYTFDVDEKLTAVTMKLNKNFAIVEGDFDAVQFENNGTANRGFFSEQTLTAWFSNQKQELQVLLDELRNQTACGLVIIRRDGNNRYWISGIAPLDKMGANRPWMNLESNFNSGLSIQDIEEGNRYELIFGRVSGTEEYFVADGTASLSEGLAGGTAAFVNWPE